MNTIFTTGDEGLVKMLAERQDVAAIKPNPALAVIEPQPGLPAVESTGVQWNISRIKADQMWASGATGQDIVVATIDQHSDRNHHSWPVATRQSPHD
ncbi:MAG: hypothetical protein EPO21_00860 [Chloroflexota bacterium]|nr:MAG: hypothetical protein EPO21_00860 [Chloroflexota bacterium]